MKTTKNLMMGLAALAIMVLAMAPVGSATIAMDAATAVGGHQQCDRTAVVATNCYYCPTMASWQVEECRNSPDQQIECSHMVRGICLTQFGDVGRTFALM